VAGFFWLANRSARPICIARQKLLPAARLGAEAAQHPRCGQVDTVLSDTAAANALVGGLYKHCNPKRLKRPAKASTTRASLEMPTTRLRGTYPTQAWPVIGAM
jgi:hypothetical protein